MRRASLLALAALQCLNGSLPSASAFAPGHESSLKPLERSLPIVVPKYDRATQERLEAASPGVARLREEAGGPWSVDFDLGSGALRRGMGTGIPLYPGPANTLLPAGKETSLAELEATTRAFLRRHADLFPTDLEEWTLSEAGSQPLVSGLVRPVRLLRHVGGVPVEPSQIQVVYNRGNLVYLNAVALEAIETSPIPGIDAETAFSALGREAASAGIALEKVALLGRPALALVPEPVAPGAPPRYRLIWRQRFQANDGLETWRSGVDAHTGELVELEDMNRYACTLDPTRAQGQVRGGVRAAEATDPEVVRNFPYPLVLDNGVPDNADANGYYFYAGGPASSALQGTYFAVTCTGCTNQPLVTTTSDGILDFGTGGVNQTTNGRSTPADRTAFYHTNVARSIGAKWRTLPWLTGSLGIVVNIAQTCNAFWNGSSLNFFRSGGGCGNTGEIRDVMQHEWGHGLDDNDGLGSRDRAMGEAYGDYIALFVDHDSCIGQSFFGGVSGPYCTSIPNCTSTLPCTGVRNIDEKRSSSGLMSMTTASSNPNCAPRPCAGPLGLECHCEGEIFGQAAFHFANNLLTGLAYDTSVPLPAGNPAFGDTAAWFIHERTFFNANGIMISYAPSTSQSMGTGAYDAYITVDDDDGNLANGTPNAAYINQAFIHHVMEERTVAPDSANCTPPADPVFTLQPLTDATSGNAQVRVSWPDLNASFYAVYRNLRLSDVWLPVRSQVLDDNRGTYEIYDEPVQIGESYNYVVLAVAANGCPSPGSTPRTVAVALPDASASVGLVVDAAPGGDGDGIPEPGERVQIRVDLRELTGLTGITNASVMLSSQDPLAAVTVAGPVTYGNVAAGGSVQGPSNFEVAISVSHGCNSAVALTAAVTADNACSLRAFSLTVPAASCVPVVRGEAIPTTLTPGVDNLDPTCTDNDGVPDNGETVAFDVGVRNTGGAATSNVTVLLTPQSPEVTVLGTNPVVIPTLAAGATGNATFQFRATGASCQQSVDLLVTVNSNENVFPLTARRTIVLEQDLVPVDLATGFEADFGAWTAVEFVRQQFRKNQGQWSIFAGPTPQPHPCDDLGDGAGTCAKLTSPPFQPGPGSQLTLANWYQLEPYGGQFWDRANVHVIEGTTHNQIAPSGGKLYDGGAGESSAFCHIDAQNAWAGNPPAGAVWGNSTFDLTPYVGREIQLEINMNMDPLATCEGFYVDDITVTNTFSRGCDALNCSPTTCTAPQLALQASSTTVCRYGTVVFTGSITSPGTGGFTYEWDFGDGTPPLVVTDPLAPVGHVFGGTASTFDVVFRARSQSAPACDAISTQRVTIDTGTAPTGGPVGNRLRLVKQQVRRALLTWTGSGVTPPRFVVRKTSLRGELGDTPGGIGDEPVLARPTVESAVDPGPFATPNPLAFYEVYPATTCGDSVIP